VGDMDSLSDVLCALKETCEPNESQEDNVLEEFRKRLELNPYYFVNWFENSQNDIRALSPDSIKEFRHELFSSTKRPRTKREIVAAAESSDIAESEFSDRKAIVAFFIEAYVTAVKKSNGYEFNDPEENNAKTFQIRSNREAKWIRLAARANQGGLQFAEKLLLQGWAIKPQYMPGVTYLNKWGRLHITLSKGKIPADNLVEYNGVEDFNALPNESKGLIMAAKSFYLGALRTILKSYKAESVEAMRQVLDRNTAFIIVRNSCKYLYTTFVTGCYVRSSLFRVALSARKLVASGKTGVRSSIVAFRRRDEASLGNL